MAGRFLSLFKPLSRAMPEIAAPKRKVGFNEKILWTGIALILYLVMAETPLYKVGTGGYELTYLRVIFASSQGTLMTLGIGPIVTAGLILQLLSGSGIIGCDMSDPDDRALFTTASKFFSILMTGMQAAAYLIGRVFGDLPAGAPLVIFVELMLAGIIVMMLDELVQKGWGIGSGISLFIMAGVAQQIFWESFNPIMVTGSYTYGAIIASIQALFRGNFTIFFDRGGYPTMLGFITTIAVFIIVIYVEGVRIELPIAHAEYRGFRGRYPIKLLYVSNLPVIFASALFANVTFISQLLWSTSGQPQPGTNLFLDLLGQFKVVTQTGSTQSQIVPTGGLAYLVTAPRSIGNVVQDPWRALGFAGIMIAFCIVFSVTWLEVGGLDPSTVAKQLVDSGMQIPGFRRSGKAIETVLKRYIPTVTILGGLIVGLIAAVSDFFGVFGSGMGVLLSVGILYQYYELLMQERVAEMYPALRGILGG